MDQNPNKLPTNTNFLAYTGMVFQLIGVIIIAYFIGQWLDHKLGFIERPYMTVTLILLFLALFLFSMIRNLMTK